MLRTGSWRREDGQTGAEYLGALMIVGAIALVVLTAGVPDAAPHAPGVVFRARLTAASAPAPDAGPPFRAAVRAGEWEVLRSCAEN